MIKWFRKRLLSWLLGSAALAALETATAVAAPPKPHEPLFPRRALSVSHQAVAKASRPGALTKEERKAEMLALFPYAEVPEWIPEAPRNEMKLALDDQLGQLYSYASLSTFGEGLGFVGYPYLAELQQRPEYRVISETIAKEMTRKWIELSYEGDEEEQKKANDKLSQLNDAMENHNLQATFRRAFEIDGGFGRGHIYIDTGATDDTAELDKPLILRKEKIKKGGDLAFRTVEPLWVYPNRYNAADPLRADFYRTQSWWVQGKAVHHSRLLTFVSREVPDMLKPAYAFGGLSTSQMAKPYIDNWLRARQSVSDLLHSFSLIVFLTNMSGVLDGGTGDDFFRRVDIFNQTRDNRGAWVADKETEDVKNLAVPLGTLDKLQAQAQEQQASVSQIPLVKLLGVTPSGLNASSDGEIRVFYDGIHSRQEHFRPQVKTALDVLQLNLFGEIDPKIKFKFVPLWELDEAARASVEKTQADTDAVLIEAGVIDQYESRTRISHDKHSAYNGLDPDDVPEPEDDEADQGGEGLGSPKADPARSAEPRETERSGV